MKFVHYVMVLILSCLSFAGGTAIASPIEMGFAGEAQKDGKVKVEFKSEPNGVVLTGFSDEGIKEGDTLKDTLDVWKKAEDTFFGDYYTFTRKKQGDYEILGITPKAGTPNFKSGKTSDNSAGIPDYYIRVLNTKKGKSTLRFQDTGALVSDGVTDWELTVLTQDLQIFGSAFLELPNMTEPSLLLSDFATQLLGENIPVSILDDALIMTSLQNNFFSISYDGDPKFFPLLANEEVPVPEPKTVFLFFIGLVALILVPNRGGPHP